MTAMRLVLAGVLAALVTVMTGGVAVAATYPDVVVTIDLSDSRFVGGKQLDYSVRASGVSCTSWVVTFNGETQTGSGTTFSGTFSTPKVSRETDKTFRAECTFGSARAEAVASAVASDTATVTLLPVGSSDTSGSGTSNGALPDTGGSNLWILIAGGALVVAGGGAVVASRRRF